MAGSVVVKGTKCIYDLRITIYESPVSKSAQLPRVSVVLPVRNGAGTLPAAIASIRAQTEVHWELVVIDDGSTDGTKEILTTLAKKDSRVRPVSLPPGGIVAALNTGLAEARAPLIARMDADDFSHPRRFQCQCDYLDAHPEIGLVSCRIEFQSRTAAAGGYERHVAWLNGVISPDQIRRQRFIESPMAHPSVMFRRSIVQDHGAYSDGDFPEDYELWLRWLEAGVAMAKVPETLLTWNDAPARLSRNCARYSTDAFYRIKARYLASHVKSAASDRPVWLWGAGRVTRRRAEWLLKEGVDFAGWIDIDPRKIGKTHAGLPVCSRESLLSSPRPFVLAYVGSWDAREIIATWLQRNGFVEERDYLLCA
jgi:glycosyltransferase involved in cell wall biosynthesis